MGTRIGDNCPNCQDSGILLFDVEFVRCDNCDFERFSTQSELDTYFNNPKQRIDHNAPRIISLLEDDPFIAPRNSGIRGMRDFDIER